MTGKYIPSNLVQVLQAITDRAVIKEDVVAGTAVVEEDIEIPIIAQLVVEAHDGRSLSLVLKIRRHVTH